MSFFRHQLPHGNAGKYREDDLFHIHMFDLLNIAVHCLELGFKMTAAPYPTTDV